MYKIYKYNFTTVFGSATKANVFGSATPANAAVASANRHTPTSGRARSVS